MENKLLIATNETLTVIFNERLDEKGRPLTIVVNDEDAVFDDVLKMDAEEIIARYATFDKNASPELRNAYAKYMALETIDIIEKDGRYEHRLVPGLSLPEQLFVEMVDAIDSLNTDYYEALVLFWLRCADNHNPQSRDDLFSFLQKNGFQLTPFGFFLTYRNVDEMHVPYNGKKYPKLFSFLQESIKQAKKWKMGTQRYHILVNKDGDGYEMTRSIKAIFSKRKIGRLDELWEYARTNAVFTDNWTKSFRIKLNEIQELARTKCDYNNERPCSSGLHVGTPRFVNRSNYGNIPMAVLVNPSDVVAVPISESEKMRVCKYLPIDFVNKGDVLSTDIDLSSVEYNYSVKSAEELKETISKQSLTELKENKLIPTGLSHDVFDNINRTIDDMVNQIKDRKVNV